MKMKKQMLMVLMMVGMLIGAGGCNSRMGMLLSGNWTLEEFNASMDAYNHGLTDAEIHDPKYRNKDGTYRSSYLCKIIKLADTINKYRTNNNTGVAVLGMTKEQVIAAKGEPNDKNYTVGSWGTHEQWMYGGYCRVTKTYVSASYLYFENGILTAWQD